MSHRFRVESSGFVVGGFGASELFMESEDMKKKSAKAKAAPAKMGKSLAALIKAELGKAVIPGQVLYGGTPRRAGDVLGGNGKI